MQHSLSLRFLLLSSVLLLATGGHADITATLESPAPNQRMSGIRTISGWAFSSVANARITLQFSIDGAPQGPIPCCGDRLDVASQYPNISPALRSGFGLLFNFNLLSEGTHTVTIEVQDDAGSPPFITEHVISVAKPGGFEFLSDLDLGTASKIEFANNNQEIFITGVETKDKTTEKQQKVNLHLAWQENAQTIGIVNSENIGSPKGGSSDDGDDDDDDDSTPPPGVILTLENPSGGDLGIATQTVGGIGVVSGWTFTNTPGATISSLHLRVDGEPVEDIPCCSQRQDVQAGYPDQPQALQSGFGALTNFSLLDPGSHTVTVEAQDSVGLTQTINLSVNTVKLGNSEFLDQFDMSTATATIDGSTLFLDEVTIRDKKDQQTTQISVGYDWEQSCQCFVAQAGCGNGTIETSEECDGAALNGESCTSLGFSGGTLTCRPLCASDDKDCLRPCIFELKDCQGEALVYVTNTKSNTVSVINPITDKVTATVKVGKEPRNIAISPDGAAAYVTNFSDNTLSMLSTATNTVTATIAVGNGPLGIAFAPDGARAYVVNGFDNTVSVLNTATKKVEATIGVGQNPQAIALTSDGKRAYVTNFADNSVTVLDLSTNRSISTILVGKGPTGIAVSPDNTTAYVVNYNGDSVSIIARGTNTVTGTVQVGFLPVQVTFSPDGTKAFVSNSVSQTISVIDTADLTIVDTFTVASGGAVPTQPYGVVVAAGGTRLYVTLFGNGFGSEFLIGSTVLNDALETLKVGDGPSAIAVMPIPAGSS